MAKDKLKFEQGVKYNGYAFINEYGEWSFKPSQKKEVVNNLKVVQDINNTTLYENKRMWKISIKIAKEQIDCDPNTKLEDLLLDAEYMFREYINRQDDDKPLPKTDNLTLFQENSPA